MVLTGYRHTKQPQNTIGAIKLQDAHLALDFLLSEGEKQSGRFWVKRPDVCE